MNSNIIVGLLTLGIVIVTGMYKLLRADPERKYIEILLNGGITDIEVSRNDYRMVVFNRYLPDEYKIDTEDAESIEAFYVAYNDIIRKTLNDYFKTPHKISRKELSDDELYYLTRAYRYYSTMITRKKAEAFAPLLTHEFSDRNEFNLAGIIAMKMYLASVIFLDDQSILNPIESIDTIRKYIDDGFIEYTPGPEPIYYDME